MAIMASCEDRERYYTGPAVVEFSNPITGYTEKLTGPSIGGDSEYGDNPNIPIRGTRDSLLIQLVSAHLDEDVDIYYEVTLGSAVTGEDFSIVGEEGVVTLSAGSSFASIYFELLNASEDPTDIRTFSVELTGTSSDDVGISVNYSTYDVSIYPMLAHTDIEVASGEFLSTAAGEAVGSTIGSSELVDVSFSASGVPTFSGTATSATFFSARVFVPDATLASYLEASYATEQLGNVTSATVDAIPTSGTTAGAAVNSSVEIVENGVYGFVNGAGKKGYIRIKSLSGSSVVLDVMVQP